MEAWATLASQLLVRTALVGIPLALFIAAICRWMPARPATRHTLWLVLLAWFLVSPMLPGVGTWNVLASKFSTPNVASPATPSASESLVVSEPDEIAVVATTESAVGNQSAEFVESIESAGPGSLRSALSPREWIQTATTSIQETIKGWSQYRLALAPSISGDTDPTPGISTETSNTFDASSANGERESAVVDSPVEPESISVAESVEPGKSRWSEWVAWMVVARDALARLPSLPPMIVFGGVIFLCGIHLLRMLLFYRRLRQTIETPASMIALVKRCAKRIGLSRMPIVQMTAENVSPMIWCGWRAKLILPMPLWLQLDEVGREAIVCHELAHLRRRDHWWCWGDLLAGTLYWWHPLVWWVRRRLHEEAEMSCDAWVIWLLPHGRRAYAEALLRTNETVGRAYPVGPAVGMAVAGGRKQQFARRLTMVMTQSTRPRMSFAGLALAVVIAAAGWAAVPARSCPPESTEKESQPIAAVEVSDATEASAQSVNLVVAQPGALTVGVISSASACPEEESKTKSKGGRSGVSNTAAGRRNLGVTGAGGAVTVVNPENGRATTVRRGQPGGSGGGGGDRIAQLERRVAELNARVEALSAHMGQAPRAPRPPTPPAPPREAQRRSAPPRARSAPSSDAIIARSYKLPKGKLDALWELMSRADVPTTVRSLKGGMEVMATEAQHEVFEAFIRLINPQGGDGPRASADRRGAEESTRARIEAQARAEALRDRLRTTQERSRAAGAERRARQRAQETHIEQLYKNAEKLREQADTMRERANEEKKNKDKSRSMIDNAKSVEQQAKAIEQQMNALERESREMEKLGDALEEETEALGCLSETFGELPPHNLAQLLTSASHLNQGNELNAVAASLGNLSDDMESDLAARIEKSLESLDFGDDLGKLSNHAKALERLCEILREKAAEIEAADESEAEEAVEPGTETESADR